MAPEIVDSAQRRWVVILVALAATAPACGVQGGQTPAEMGAMDSTDAPAAAAAHHAMGGDMAENPHMRMTSPRPGNAADSARAMKLVSTMRRDLDRYQDVRVAEADGFRQFLPGVRQPIYHFTNWRWAVEAMFRFDASHPTSLLYQTGPDGQLRLLGAMYTAPARSSEDDLDRRIPLSVSRWHEHVNWCLPPRGAPGRWRDQRDGRPLFGPESPIASRAACDAVGGRFRQRLFGWMVHVQAFASDDPAVIWHAGHH